jgi:hypothetical protein
LGGTNGRSWTKFVLELVCTEGQELLFGEVAKRRPAWAGVFHEEPGSEACGYGYATDSENVWRGNEFGEELERKWRRGIE